MKIKADADANDRHGLSDRSTAVSSDGVGTPAASGSANSLDHAMQQTSVEFREVGRTRDGKPILADRSKYIGSSDAALVADLSPWGSPLTVWNRLVGLTPAEGVPSLRMWLGKQLEPIVLDLYHQRTGKLPERVIDDNDPPVMSREYPYIGAHPDYERLEIKTTRSAREWGDDGETVTRVNMAIPLHYFLQVEHLLYVMGWDVMDVAVLIGHDEFRTYTVPADPVVISRLIDAEVELWDFALRGEPPPKSDPQSRAAYLKARFPNANIPARPATPEDELIVTTWRDAVQRRIEAEVAEELAAFNVKHLVGEHEGLSGLVTYRPQTRTDIDVAVLKEQLHAINRADIIQAATRTNTFRVLRSVSRKED